MTEDDDTEPSAAEEHWGNTSFAILLGMAFLALAIGIGLSVVIWALK